MKVFCLLILVNLTLIKSRDPKRR